LTVKPFEPKQFKMLYVNNYSGLGTPFEKTNN